MAEKARPSIVGPDSGPEPPYPLRMSGPVISGFGRGSKELGIPTANLPVDSTATPWIADIVSGVYFGWASIALPAHHPDAAPTADGTNGDTSTSTSTSDGTSSGGGGPPAFRIFPMVMSIGYNPFYKNTVRSAEVHVLHTFGADFYGAEMRLLLLGFIREERDYASLDALIADINTDCDVARASLARPAWTPRELDAAAGQLDGRWLIGEKPESAA
ncbi:hypothetical protein VTK73DRAFT_2234 [Phialemonium thermophilum]|uniref:Riboflavin kinase n=1 Tax=Phialemonium thermophilum TaxID=223376 RepID=A0ABR3X676_9PEZI